MSEKWLSGKLLAVEQIQTRLKQIFPRELDVNGYIIREMGAKTVFTMLYGFCVGGEEWIRPATITCMTDAQAVLQTPAERKSWLEQNQSKSAPRDVPGRWYKPNTREPIRDETLREMVRLNAVIERSGLPTTSPLPKYSLQSSFADLFNPALDGDALSEAVQRWQQGNLSAEALARVTLKKRLVTASTAGVLVELPNGETRKMAYGPSSILAKAVVEQFAKKFMKDPAVILMSESARKMLVKDDDLCQALGFKIDVSAVLPDLILVDLGEKDPLIVFVECVATDGPVNERRKAQLVKMARDAGYLADNCAFVTVFMDRADDASRKLISSVAWGTFVWYASEPEKIIYLCEQTGQSKVSLGTFLKI